MSVTIGQAARRTGCPAATIRYYERVGLLPEPRRSGNGYRRYDGADVQRLEFVIRARELGFSLADVRELLELADHPQMPCDSADGKVREHLRAVRGRIAMLARLDAELADLETACDGNHPAVECGILASLDRSRG